MLNAPRTTQAFATNFRKPIARPVTDRAAAMADEIVGMCRAGKTEVTDRELQEAGFTDAEIRNAGPRARSLAAHKINRRAA